MCVWGGGICDSGLVVLMSRHFSLQLLCHLTSQLFHKKGHSSYKKRWHVYSIQPLTTFQLRLNTTITNTKNLKSWKKNSQVLVTQCTPTLSYQAIPHTQQASSETSDTGQICTAQQSCPDLLPMVTAVSYILLINWDTARQIVSLQLSGFIWTTHSLEILNIKDLTSNIAKFS